MEEAHDRAEEFKNEFERKRQAVKAKWRDLWQTYWRSLLGLDAPHAENGLTIEPLPSEVPPVVEETEIIPSSYGNLPIETDTPPASTPETVEPNTPVESWETETPNPEPATRLISRTLEPKNTPLEWSVSTDIKPVEKPEEEKKIPEKTTHKVQRWDTLFGLAKKYWKTIEELCTFNNISQETTLHIGQVLALKLWVKIPEQEEKKPEEEKKLARGLTKTEHIALILETCKNKDIFGDIGREQVAYILATADHESGHFLPIYNLVEKENRKSWPGFINYDTRADLWNTVPGDGARFKWRGYVQLTGRYNYTKYDPILKEEGLISPEQSIITNPDLVLDPKIAAFILVHGMINGSFGNVEIKWEDGKTKTKPARLGDFINKEQQDWEWARQTVNGNDKAWTIGMKAKKILKTLPPLPKLRNNLAILWYLL